jgi:hypothetical protein
LAILTTGQVIARVGALLDDPGNRRFTADYLRPYVDQENASIEIMLEMLGVQQMEQIAIFNVPAAVPGLGGNTPPTDLAPYFQPGQPLEWLLRPKRLDWKIQGQPDTSYIQSSDVNELDDVIVGNLGCQQYRWAAGSIQTTPSYTPVTLRLYFFALNTDIYDSAAPIMRGIGNILAAQVATFVADLNNGMGKTGPRIEKNLARDKRAFSNLLVMQGQAELKVPRGTKRGYAAQLSAGGIPYI